MMNSHTLFEHDANNQTLSLFSPTLMPNASGFLWNRNMMIHMNCRGYAIAQHMQPEPAKYAYGPALEAKTFMQPEHNYFSHHPGRFFYVKLHDTQELFSLPYEPVRSKHDHFEFVVGDKDICWEIQHGDLLFHLTLDLAEDDVVEKWQLQVTNQSSQPVKFSLYPYFSIGYMSWMNQSARYEPALNAIVATSITPYQKLEDYPRVSQLKDKTFLAADTAPDSWLTRMKELEGEGSLQAPQALEKDRLSNSDANYDVPTAVMQYDLELAAGQSRDLNWLFGPAKDEQDIENLRQKYLLAQHSTEQKAQPERDYSLEVNTPDTGLNCFLNHWLPRQLRYHGELHRLTTDPQTRNFLQDIMGMVYLDPVQTRASFLIALSQQSVDGDMPDGILLHPDAELKYINQIPHTDHCVWLAIFIDLYLRETNDFALLDEQVVFADSKYKASVFEHMELAMQCLYRNLDYRRLSLINQGDWCDPMNMVGHKGKGVSAWLSMATAYSFDLWAQVCIRWGREDTGQRWLTRRQEINQAVNHHFWKGEWYARGITDDNVTFGVPEDQEGRIFLNPQTWSMLCGAASEEQQQRLLTQVDEQLQTPYGPMMLAPSYTQMREDVGRVTQKFPGTSENGSVYNHAAAFYAYSLFDQGLSQAGFEVMQKMMVDQDDALIKGQLPVFIPNYYRGAYHQYPQQAGRSSHLFNTGTVAWFYRCLVEGIFGLKGNYDGLLVQPQLPQDWHSASATRHFAGARFDVSYERRESCTQQELWLDGVKLSSSRVTDITAGQVYQLQVVLPLAECA